MIFNTVPAAAFAQYMPFFQIHQEEKEEKDLFLLKTDPAEVLCRYVKKNIIMVLCLLTQTARLQMREKNRIRAIIPLGGSRYGLEIRKQKHILSLQCKS